MSLKIQGEIVNIGTYNDNSKEYHIDARGKDLASVMRALDAEDITPADDLSSSGAPDFSSEIPDSFIFTKKAHQEHKIPTIVQALQKSIIRRKDKTRALVQELQEWQKSEYVDAHYNAQVMFDELQKVLPLPFGYDAFKRLYNNTRS